MTFSAEEKDKAASIVYNIHSVTGVVGGSVTAETVMIGDYTSIHQMLKDCDVSQDERNEIENIMDSLAQAEPEERESLVQKGLDWVNRNKVLLGSLAATIKAWFESGP